MSVKGKRMKNLVICQYYKPEPFRISDICEELVKLGHSVTVVTGNPNYPEGNIYDDFYGEDFKKHQDEICSGVNVHRCKIVPRKTGSIFRVLNYYSYAIKSTMYTRKLENDFDVVLVNQLSPVMMAYAGLSYKKKHNKKLLLYCLDIWPESLSTMGIKKGNIVYSLFHKISRSIYEKSDEILITSKTFEDYLSKEFNIDKEKITYLPQYAESLFSEKSKIVKTKSEVKNFVFAGNIGIAQNLKTVILAADKLQNEKVHFHIVGSGLELDNLKKLSASLNLKNVTFHGRKPITDMPYYYHMADAMLITLYNHSVMSSTLPGKMQSYMSAGKPVIGAIDGETQKIIDMAKCGFCGNSENPDDLAQNIIKFINLTAEEISQMGKNSYDFYDENFSKEKILRVLEEKLIQNI